jgi:drug/metabolite transporter (DMT)-like permease
MNPEATQTPKMWRGWVALILAASISGSNYVISRYGMKMSIGANDMIALRVGIAGLVMLPMLWRIGLERAAQIGLRRGLLLTALAGAPYSLMIVWGLRFAPAAHGGVLVTATGPLVVALGLWIALGVRLSGKRLLLLGVILTGIILVMGGISVLSNFSGPNVLLGDMFFVLAGANMAVYSILLRIWRFDALLVSALVSVLSLVYLPIYYFWLGPDFSGAALGQILFHGFNQGVLNAVVALFLLGYSVAIIGPQQAVLGAAIVPVISALLAIPMLGELPGPLQWLGIALVAAGVVFSARLQDAPPSREVSTP